MLTTRNKGQGRIFDLTGSPLRINALCMKYRIELVMIKAAMLLAVILLPVLLSAQEESFFEQPESGFRMSGNLGFVTVGSQSYTQLRFMPEITVWKLGFGLDLDFLVDAEGNLRKDDWDETADLIRKIYYIRYARRGEAFYARAGGFTGHTLGHGLIMRDYNNMLLYPEKRNIGLLAGANLPLPMNPGIEIFTSDVTKNEILTASFAFQPFLENEVRYFSDVVVGISLGTDRNQYGRFEDRDKDKIPDVIDPHPRRRNYAWDIDGDGIPNHLDPDMDGDGFLDSPWVNPYVAENFPALSDSSLAVLLDNDIPTLRFYGDKSRVMVYGLNYELPVVQTSGFTLGHYAEYAMIQDYGSGLIFPGFAASFLVFDANLEFRTYSQNFLPAYFDRLYDEQRAFVQNGEIITKDSTLDDVRSAYGWYGSVNANLFNTLILKAAFQDMYGEDLKTGKSIWAGLGLDPKVLPKIREICLSYSKTNVEYISIHKLRTPSALVEGRAAYGLADNVYLVGRYSERYFDLNGDREIRGKDEVFKTFRLSVEFSF